MQYKTDTIKNILGIAITKETKSIACRIEHKTG
jgi:hypothetical protein